MPRLPKPKTDSLSLVQDVLRSPGQPLDAAVRTTAEADFGHHFDFSQVRVHTDAKVGESAQAINASAFTVGQHIAFAPGRYKPQSSGRKLLVHELVHTIQQRQGAAFTPVVGSEPIRRADPQGSFEREADRQAANVIAGARADVAPVRTPTMVMKQDSGRGGSRSRRARITEQDRNGPSVLISSRDYSEHHIVVGEGGEISLSLQITHSEQIFRLRVMIEVYSGENRFLVDYIDVGESPSLVIRTVNVPEGQISIRLSQVGFSTRGNVDEDATLAVGQLEISGR